MIAEVLALVTPARYLLALLLALLGVLVAVLFVTGAWAYGLVVAAMTVGLAWLAVPWIRHDARRARENQGGV